MLLLQGGTDLIPGQGAKILHAVWHSQKKKKKEHENINISSLQLEYPWPVKEEMKCNAPFKGF